MSEAPRTVPIDLGRQRAVEAYRSHLEAIASVEEQLALHRAATLVGLENLESGGGSAFEPLGRPAAKARVGLTEVLAEFEQSRRRCRVAILDLAVAEGRTISEVARQWGVSRQYLWALIHAEDSPSQDT